VKGYTQQAVWRYGGATERGFSILFIGRQQFQRDVTQMNSCSLYLLYIFSRLRFGARRFSNAATSAKPKSLCVT
jgi:hypothetical protein